MRQFLLFILLISLFACARPQPAEPAALLPEPLSVTYAKPAFLADDILLVFVDDCAAKAADALIAMLREKSIDGRMTTNRDEATIILSCDTAGFHLGQPDHEAYTLSIAVTGIELSAPYETGLHRGISTLEQILDQEWTAGRTLITRTIRDQPAFVHRGMLMDVCRHFFSKEVVKEYIDRLAYYKMNTLHLHLTEDQGWRLAIDKYPKLTEIGAWRTELDGSRYGGFYTKEDIREVVAYAEARHIRIIPEIELPGHSQAALAAYPHLSCTGGPIEVANDWGVFKEIYCAGNDSTFIFLKDVLTEVMELFPSRYIHIGGDEAPKYRWENCDKCQRRIAEEGLHDEHELQSWFIEEIGAFLEANGRTLIGWDEILEGGLPEGAMVQSWRGFDGGIEAAKQGTRVVMSPTSHCYFDYDLKAIDVEKVYSFNPIPKELDSELHPAVSGGECNLWSEHIPDKATLDRQTFPRLLAMSEVLWTAPEQRDYDLFKSRMRRHYPVLRERGIAYGHETIPFTHATTYRNDSLLLVLEPQQEGLSLEVELDHHQVSYEDPLWIQRNGAKNVIIQPLRDGQPVGGAEVLQMWAHHANGITPELNTDPSEYYTAGGPQALTDGILGSTDFRDGHWMGFWGEDAEVVIDLGEVRSIDALHMQTYQYNNAWIFSPREVEFQVSDDGENWVPLTVVYADAGPEHRGKFQSFFSHETPGMKRRYVKAIARNLGKVPDWHEAAGADAWVFIGELIVQ
jgi:hexosaminidase